jgi:hypothetical protein
VVSSLGLYGIFPKPKFMKNIMLFGNFDSFVPLQFFCLEDGVVTIS